MNFSLKLPQHQIYKNILWKQSWQEVHLGDVQHLSQQKDKSESPLKHSNLGASDFAVVQSTFYRARPIKQVYFIPYGEIICLQFFISISLVINWFLLLRTVATNYV